MKLSRTISQAAMCLTLIASFNHAQAYQYSGQGCGPINPYCLDIDLTASYLYWNVQQDYLGKGAGNIIFGSVVPEVCNHKWDSGFRIEAELSDNCSPIGCDFQWTYFKTSTGDSKSINTANSILELPPAIIDISTSWKIHINEFAFDIDYSLCLDSCVTLRPYLGVFAAAIYQKHNVIFNLQSLLQQNLGTFRKNDFWGIGPRAGIAANWNFAEQFSLVWDSNFACLVGKTKSQIDFEIPTALPTEFTSLLDTNSRIWCTRPMASTFIGLNWDGCIRCWLLSASIGYEFQYWWNQWRASPFPLDALAIGQPRSGDLAVNGLVFSLGITF